MPPKIKIAALLQLLLIAQPVHAAITLDGTLGRSGAITGPNFAITPDLGKQVGTNLFHSFSKFDLVKGDIATFSGTTNVSNIISRVTGGSASNIDGTLKSTISGANMYFLNPAGVIFGPNASLDISGSFHVSTADYLKLGADGRFDVAIPANSVLTTAPPSAFGFVAAKPAPITVNGSGSNYVYVKYGLYGLYVKTGNTISVIGGDITFNNGIIDDQTASFILVARGGRLNVASVASSGEVVIENDNLAMNGVTNLGNIIFQANNLGKPIPSVDISSGQIDLNPNPLYGPAGKIYIRGNNLQSNGFIIESVSNDNNLGATVDVRLNGDLQLNNTSFNSAGNQQYAINNATIDNNTKITAYGARGVTIDALGDINIAGIINSRTLKNTDTGGININANNVVANSTAQLVSEKGVAIDAKGNISFSGTIDSTTWRYMDTGVIKLNGNNVVISDGTVFRTTNYNDGKSGNIELTAQNSVNVYGNLYTNSSGKGDSGNIIINAGLYQQNGVLASGGMFGKPGDIFIYANGKVDINSAIRATSFAEEGSGNISIKSKGDININGYIGGESMLLGHAGNILLDGNNVNINNTLVTSVASSSGNAGDITISASDHINVNAKIYSIAILGTGNGGNISLSSRILSIGSAGEVNTSSTLSEGNAGNINIQAQDALSISGIVSSVTKHSANAGNILIQAPYIDLNDSAQILVSTGSESTGKGGAIKINGGQLRLTNAILQADTAGSGVGGNVDINVRSLSLDSKASISAGSSGSGRAGNLDIKAIRNLTLTDSSITTATANADGGSITIDPVLVHLKNSSITTSVKGGTGNGGNIDLTAKQLVLENSKIVAQADAGNGGNINLNADVIIQSPTGSLISASSNLGVQGSVVLSSPVLDVNAALVEMPSSLRDIASLSPRRCITTGDEISSFVVYACAASSRRADAAIIGK